jgi:quercetin dioxygenase-like cupin family protein
VFLQEGAEGSGPVPHSHPWDESFYVIRGEIEFAIEEKSMTATPGTLVHLPAGTAHWFRFGKGGGQMVSMTGQGSAASSMFTDIDSVGSQDVEMLRDACERNGLRIL